MKPLSSAEVIAWLTAERYAKLGEAREAMLEQVCKIAPNIPTAGIWLLQHCCIMPSVEDLTRWSEDVAKLQKPAIQEPLPKPRAARAHTAN